MQTASQRGPGRPVDPAIRQRREEEILDAAARLFAERGYAGANTQVLADTLNVGKGTIFRYFPTKQELFLAAVDRAMDLLKETVDAALVGIEDPIEQILRAMHAYLAFFAEHPEYVELLIQERAEFKDRKKPTYFVHREANIGRWRNLLLGLIATGRVRDITVEGIMEVIGDLLYGTMFTNYFVGRTRSPREQAEEILDVAFHGILSDSERKLRQSAAGRESAPHAGPASSLPCRE
jgi:AcrR family transcriptional regulator